MQKTAYEMRISDWSSDVCSSELMSACPSEGFVPEMIAKHQTLRPISFSFENREKATRTIRRPTKPRSKDRLSSVCRCIGVRRSSRDLLNLLPLDFMWPCKKLSISRRLIGADGWCFPWIYSPQRQ